MKFAKLYETYEYGQILVMLTTNEEDKPTVLFHIQPEGFGVCSIGPTFKDTDAGWDNAEMTFDMVTEEIAKEFAAQMMEVLE